VVPCGKTAGDHARSESSHPKNLPHGEGEPRAPTSLADQGNYGRASHHRAPVHRPEPGQDLKEGGLTGSVRPHQGGGRAGGEGDCYITEGHNTAPVDRDLVDSECHWL
ncbi:uncharacterized protein METZ01_LOCUS124185, partial [marine metagenome]